MYLRQFEWKMKADKRAYKTRGNRGLFDLEEKKSKLTSSGNLLERLLKAVDFGMFRKMPETWARKQDQNDHS